MTLMNDIFREHLDKFVNVYLDDILIYSKTWSDHLKHIEIVLDILRKEKLFGKFSKCIFGATEIEYLGHVLTQDGVRVDPHKVKAVREWPIPQNKTQIQSFLGFVNYYRRFIKNCSLIAKPLTTLTASLNFEWTEEQQTAFDVLKRALRTAPVLHNFDPNLPTTVTTDASKFAIGAVMDKSLTRRHYQ